MWSNLLIFGFVTFTSESDPKSHLQDLGQGGYCLVFFLEFHGFRSYIHDFNPFGVFSPSAVQLKGSSLPVVQLLSHVQLPVDPMDRSPPDSFVHGISQARIIE